MPAIHLRVACRQQPASRMDASGQGESDSAGLELSMAGNSGPCCGRGWPAPEGESDQLAEGILPAEPTAADLSDRRRMDCVWAPAIPDRNGGAAVERQESVDVTGRPGANCDPSS